MQKIGKENSFDETIKKTKKEEKKKEIKKLIYLNVSKDNFGELIKQ